MQEIELDIEGIAQGGAGVGRWNGRTVFVTGGLPHERVRVRFASPHEAQSSRSYTFAHVTEVIRPSPDRVDPRLPMAGHMPWQHIAYAAQLRFKEIILREQLARLAGISDVPIAPIIPAHRPWSYRNSAHLHVDGTRIGYYAPGTHDVVDLIADPLLHPALNEALTGLRRALDLHPEAQLTNILLRASDAFGYAIAALMGTHLQHFAETWKLEVPSLAAVLTELPTRVPAANPPVTLHEELAGIVFSLTAMSFFQVHTAQAEQLLATIRTGLDLASHAQLLDGYSGVGTFALPLAAAGHQVWAIEENPHAVADGQRSAALNGVTGVTFYTSPVERILAHITTPFDAAILDPPRRGCHPAALAALIAHPPPYIAYVSCHPGILARDLRILIEGGYTIKSITPVDLFPQTPHIECVVVLHWR